MQAAQPNVRFIMLRGMVCVSTLLLYVFFGRFFGQPRFLAVLVTFGVHLIYAFVCNIVLWMFLGCNMMQYAWILIIVKSGAI